MRLVADVILDATAPDEWILDPFLGSGVTLLAAERTRRRYLRIRISPAYVDLAIRRWGEVTELEAVHAATDQTFAARAHKRSVDAPPKSAPDLAQMPASVAPGIEFPEG